MEISGPDFNTFMTIMKDLDDHDMKVTDWDNHGNIELQWASPDGSGYERRWLYSADDVVTTINEIKEAMRCGEEDYFNETQSGGVGM